MLTYIYIYTIDGSYGLFPLVPQLQIRRGFPGDVREAVQKECDAKMHKYLGPIYRCFTMFYL